MGNGKRPPLKTDGPTFIPTLCAVLVELASMYDAAVAEERSLVNARTKIEKDLAKVGDDDSPEANRVRVADSKIRQALKACRAQIDHLGDQIRSGIKHGQQPLLIQSEHEDRILELVAEKQDVKHRMELWQAISSESRKVGSQTGEGEAGPVGEPDSDGESDDGEEGPTADSRPPAPLAPDSSGLPMIARTTPVDVLDRNGKVVAVGQFDSYRVADEMYSVMVDGVTRGYDFTKYTIRPQAVIPIECKVRVLHIATHELKGEGTLEHETAELYRVRIGPKVKDFPRDVYRIEAVKPEPAAAAANPATPPRGSMVRVTNRGTGEVEGDGKLQKWHDDYAIVAVGGRDRRFAFDAYSVAMPVGGIAAMVKGEIHETKPAAEKPAKPAKGAKKKSAKS
jgi:hypothetical protein